MLGSSAAREAGSAPLTLQQTAPHEDQENINPEKASHAQQPRTRARLAVLKAGNQRAPAPPQRPKTRRVQMSLVLLGVRQGRGARRHVGLLGRSGSAVRRPLVSGVLGGHWRFLPFLPASIVGLLLVCFLLGYFSADNGVKLSPATCVVCARHHALLLAFKS